MDEQEKKDNVYKIANVIVFCILTAIIVGSMYCSAVIYKGIIRDAVIEAIQYTKVKL